MLARVLDPEICSFPTSSFSSPRYRKNEIAKRLGVYVSAGAIAGGFSGLIAYGGECRRAWTLLLSLLLPLSFPLEHPADTLINSSTAVASISSPPIASWRILFLIDGLPSILLAIVLFFGLPSRPQTSTYLTEDERALELKRLDLDSLGEAGTRIDLRAVGKALTDWKCYFIAGASFACSSLLMLGFESLTSFPRPSLPVVYACMNLTLGSVTSYLPAIVKGLGYTNARAQLYTVPPYAVRTVASPP